MKDLNKERRIFWRSSSICKRKDLILPHEHLKKYRKGKGGLGRKVTSFKASCVTVRTLCPGGLGNSVPQLKLQFPAIQEYKEIADSGTSFLVVKPALIPLN